MSPINDRGVRVWRHLLLITASTACCVCVGAGQVAAQGVRISDADVSLADVAVVSHAVKEESVKMQGPLMPFGHRGAGTPVLLVEKLVPSLAHHSAVFPEGVLLVRSSLSCGQEGLRGRR